MYILVALGHNNNIKIFIESKRKDFNDCNSIL